jgi:hypothetical protein
VQQDAKIKYCVDKIDENWRPKIAQNYKTARIMVKITGVLERRF